jgi:hypothetical protein
MILSFESASIHPNVDIPEKYLGMIVLANYFGFRITNPGNGVIKP